MPDPFHYFFDDGLRFSCTQCGKCCTGAPGKVHVTGSEAAALAAHLGLTRWAFDVDLLFQLRRHNFRITELPTTWRDAGGSKLKIVKSSTEMFIAICRLRLLYSPFKWVVTLYDRTVGRVVHLEKLG